MTRNKKCRKNALDIQRKTLDKDQQSKPKARRKEIIKIRIH